MYDKKTAEKICILRDKRHELLKVMALEHNHKDHKKLKNISRHLYWLTKNPIYL